MAVTLLQQAIDERVDPMTRALITMYDQFSPVMSMIPMDGIDGRYYEYERVTTMPASGWRPFNAAWPESTGITTPYREFGKIAGGEVKVDVQLLRTAKDGGRKTKRRQTEMKVLAAANEWDRCFFEGSELNNPDEMIGLRARCSGNQLLNMGTGGGTVTLAKLRELRDAVPFSSRPIEGMKRGSGVKVCFYMNRTMRRKIDQLIEAQTGSLRIEREQDEFGLWTERFADADIKVVEQTGTGDTTLGFDEDDGSGNADTTSIYCVAYGSDLCHGFYNNQGGRMLDKFEVPEMESEPRWLLRFEGYYGIAIDHPRAVARLNHINNA